MKILSICLILLFSIQSFANCLPDYQRDIESKTISRQKLNRSGTITTAVSGSLVGGFYGTMAIILIGPWWTFFAVGGPFGAAVALPVGSTFFIISKIKKNNIKKRMDMANLISLEPNTINKFLYDIKKFNPNVTRDELILKVNELNNSRALCDGSLTHRKRKIVLPKEFNKMFKIH